MPITFLFNGLQVQLWKLEPGFPYIVGPLAPSASGACMWRN
jgi:hypothetical protein